MFCKLDQNMQIYNYSAYLKIIAFGIIDVAVAKFLKE